MIEQKTLRQPIEFAGHGLHTGRAVLMRLLPGAVDSGILFIRTDRGGHFIPARGEYLESTRLSTTLSRNGIRVRTVEHLLSTFTALGVDNVRVELDGPEVPILDGSAAPFARALQETGFIRQRSPRRFLTVLKPVEVSEGDRRLAVFPSNELRATYAIDFPHPTIGYQEIGFRISAIDFVEEIAPARTFCLYEDVQAMHRQGLALGGDLTNAVVVGEDRVLSGPLRYSDEFVRHKILDLLGDLALLGHPLRGHLIGFKGGHRLHTALVRKILAERDAWLLSADYPVLPTGELKGFDHLKAGVLSGQPAVV